MRDGNGFTSGGPTRAERADRAEPTGAVGVDPVALLDPKRRQRLVKILARISREVLGPELRAPALPIGRTPSGVERASFDEERAGGG